MFGPTIFPVGTVCRPHGSTLIALLPELGRMSRKQVAALVGVAPYAFESGKFKGRRCIWGGAEQVPRAGMTPPSFQRPESACGSRLSVRAAMPR